MRWVVRLALFATGCVLVAYGLEASRRGIFVYQNTWFRGTHYSSGTVAIGIFVALLAFLPPTRWVEHWMNRGKKSHAFAGKDRHGRR